MKDVSSVSSIVVCDVTREILDKSVMKTRDPKG
jgi:hypothetical protein